MVSPFEPPRWMRTLKKPFHVADHRYDWPASKGDELTLGALGVYLVEMRDETPGHDAFGIATLLDGHAAIVGDDIAARGLRTSP